MNIPNIQWYPGHIAKAEKQLNINIKKVDLIIEVRDARIPLSTSHPHLRQWTEGKKHILVINRKDMITKKAIIAWDIWFRNQGHSPWWSNSKDGTGVKQILEAAIKEGEAINKRRQIRGMKDRPIRALALGFPNVGKSALINRLVKKKVAASARKAGVTRTLQWIRVGQRLDLLDAPGVLPTRLDNQKAALKLAICDDIGQGAYDVESVAIAFVKMLHKIENNYNDNLISQTLLKRYGIPLEGEYSEVENWLIKIAQNQTSGDTRRMSQRILSDFRKNLLGLISLELPE